MIPIFYGQRVYGRTDRLPGLFCVGTLFFHVYFIPIYPICSVIAQGNSESEEHGIQIPFQLKSLVLAWSRAATLLISIAFAAWDALSFAPEGKTARLSAVALFLAAFLILIILPRFQRPSFDRACRLGYLLNLNEDAWKKLYGLYGKAWTTT